MTNPIQNYYRKLDDLRRMAGADNESALRTAFQILLDTLGQEHGLILHNEYPFTASNGSQLRIDGALVDRLRLVHGYWEAKDEKDDLDKEIEAKLAKGYPNDNIIFEDTCTAVLLQNGHETIRCKVADAAQLQKLLNCFFAYERPEVKSFRLAKAKFLIELPKVATALTQLLNATRFTNALFQSQAENFLHTCKSSIGENVTVQHVDEMLIQHILTDSIFRSIFPDSRFHSENHLARAISELEQSFFHGHTRANLLKRLEPYFAAIRQAATNTTNSAEKQEFLKQVYEDFYTAYNPKDADKLGVVYTPKEVVRFIIEGCDWLTQRHFYKCLADKGLDILDPCMGTGTFIVDLLDYWRGDHHALTYKFTHEVHANEIAILPYYIANLNVEQAYDEIIGQWCEFSGACFVNTLHNFGFEQTYTGAQNDLFGTITKENKRRIINQNTRSIPVIIGNPPYNANQQNENDDNKNDPAPIVDKRIKDTYLYASTAQKTKLYDPYIRFFRWASDRIGERGVIGFITNRSYLDSRQADGLRKTVTKEFHEIWIVDLMSDVRKNPKISGIKHNIFGIQTGVAIVFLVRISKNMDRCAIHYLSLDDFLLASEKRRWLRYNTLSKLAHAGQFRGITPDRYGTWLNQAEEFADWNAWLPIASKEAKAGKTQEVIFKLHSLGLNTARDAWVYGMSVNEVAAKVRYFLEHYEALKTQRMENDGGIKWSETLKRHLKSQNKEVYKKWRIQIAYYRPFYTQKLYLSPLLIDRLGQQLSIFPIGINAENLAIGISGNPHAKPFQTLVVSFIPCLDLLEKTQFLPLWIYAKDGSRHDNITDWALHQFHQHYANAQIEKIDIFHYVYAVLHDPRYRQKFALNLKTEFPRIPFHPEFFAWANIGAQLIKLHAYFDQVQLWPLQRVDNKTGTVKTKLKADKVANRIEIDTQTTLMNVPEPAWNYQLGNRSALEWVLDQYKEKTPKDSTIREQFNTYRFADYKEQIIELLGKVCRVSVETVELIQAIEQLTW